MFVNVSLQETPKSTATDTKHSVVRRSLVNAIMEEKDKGSNNDSNRYFIFFTKSQNF